MIMNENSLRMRERDRKAEAVSFRSEMKQAKKINKNEKQMNKKTRASERILVTNGNIYN
jgi:hypothetical protein